MKAITVYEANDGARFDIEAEAIKYEEFLEKIANARKLIAYQEDWNAEVGLENSQENINKFHVAFSNLLEAYQPHLLTYWLSNPRGIVGRYLSDSDGPFARKLYDLYSDCVSKVGEKDGKTYGQVYYAIKKGGNNAK